MSTSPTFNTVTAKTINLNNPGQMSAAGTVIARDFTATGNIWAANGAVRMATFSQVQSTGNVRGVNLVATAIVSGQSIIGTVIRANNSLTVGGLISAGGTVTGGALQTGGSISAIGTISGGNLAAQAQISAGGNITGNYLFGNGAFLTGIAGGGGGGSYGNANVAAYLPTYTGALTGANLTVGASQLINNNLSIQNSIIAGNNITGANLFGTIRTASQTGITQVGTLGTLSVAGQIQAGSMALAGAATVGGALSATGTISALAYAGNGYSLTNLLRSNQTRTVYVQSTTPVGANPGDIWFQTTS